MTVDLSKAAEIWPVAVQRLQAETNARRRTALRAVLAHCWAEHHGDLAMLLRATADKPAYNLWGVVSRPGPMTQADVLSYWQADHPCGIGQLTFEIDSVVVDTHRVVTEGCFRRQLSGGAVAAVVAVVVDEAPKPNRWYLVEYRGVATWSLTTDGRIARKDLYIGTPPTVVADVSEKHRDAAAEATAR